MLSPLLVTTSHTEPVFTPGDFPLALERVAASLYYLANAQGVTPIGRAKVRVLAAGGELPTMLVGALMCRGPELPDPPATGVVDDVEYLPLVAVSEPTG